jgi:DNA-binding SARP family transcriptional activator/ABC-type branched-subunit amino acid transport system substrate-binding protein/DNA-binding beta-propeller fold protein YncE
METALEARILGPLEALVGGRRVEIKGRKQRELLAILLLRANEIVQPDVLIEELWGEDRPASALKTLQTYVSRLRTTLGSGQDALETHGHGYRLRLEPGRLDAEAFRRGLEAGRRALARGEPAVAADELERVLALWRGPALADFRYETFAQAEIERLEELRLAAREERIEADLELGRHDELVPELQALVAEQPLRERPRGQLMLALYRSGRQAEALNAYQEGRRALADELGLEPSESLQRLQRQILDHDPALAAPAGPTRPRIVPTAAWRHPRRIVAAGALVLAVALGAAFYQGTRGSETIEAAGALALDPSSGDLIANVPLGTAPSEVAVGDGSVWVVDADDRTISQIDPESRSVERTFSTSSIPTDIAVGDGAVWITNAPIGEQSNTAEDWLPASVSRLDPESGLVVQTIELRPAPGGHLPNALPGLSVQHVAVSPEAVWVINRDLSVSRIDPRSNRIVAQVEGVKANNIAVGDGDVWVAEEEGIAEIDPSTDEVARRVPLDGATPSSLAVGGGAVWAADPEGGKVWRVDTGPRLQTTATEVETWVARLAFGEGALWATNEIADSIHRIDPRTGASRRIAGATSPRGIDAGDGSVWVTAATPPSEDAALPAAVCRNVDFGGDGSPDALLVSSLPLQSGWSEATQPMIEAIRLVLEQRGYEAGAFSVGFQSCDSSTAQAGDEDFFRCGSNAKAFARNLKVVGVFGSHKSFCSYLQIPIANQAQGGPLAMISPSNTFDDLTEDDGLYPSGTRSFFRLAAANRYQGGAQVELAKQLGHNRLFLLTSADDDYGALYPRDLRAAARRLAVDIVGSATFDPDAGTFRALVRRVSRARPESVAIVGLLTPGTGAMVRELRAALGKNVSISAPDAFALPEDLRKLAGDAAIGMYVTTYGITNDRLPPKGKQFLQAYAAVHGGDPGPDVAASYGAQAAEILLDAIARSDGTRASVTEQLRQTDVRNGILGNISWGAKGDLAEGPITILRMTGDELVVDRVVVVRPLNRSR